MNFNSLGSMWDIAQAPSQFSQLPDDDFLALLQKQFPPPGPSDLSTNSSTVLNERQSPPSDDSSPSPPNTDAASRRQSIHVRANDTDDPSLKRKASSDDMEAGPSSKNQHTADDGNPNKKIQPSRRKSTGNPQQDESRQLKRKEQNRAAQRAFRERKEKHVKDLEDKVAALEAKNEATEAENTNLRDLLSRLQQENLALKQSQFTFSVPKPPSISAPTPSSTVQPTSFSFFDTPSPFPPPSAPAQAVPKSSGFNMDIDWSALTTFDPTILSILDEPPDVPMQTDTTSSPFGQYALPRSYKTIANNPLLTSFVDESPLASSNTPSSASSFDQFSFNFSSPATSWASATQSPTFTQNSATQGDYLHPNHSLDELFGGNFAANQGPLDFSALVDATLSPVSHTNGVKVSPVSQNSEPSNSDTSSPSTSTSHSPFSWATLSQAGESPPSASESMPSNGACYPFRISRSEFAKRIAAAGPSPFTDPPNPVVQRTSDVSSGELIACQGSKFPRIKESPDNIEALKAWRTITQDPLFKEADITELCTAFSTKARCDGTKVVLEPEGVQQLFERFKKLQQQAASAQSTQLDLPSS